MVVPRSSKQSVCVSNLFAPSKNRHGPCMVQMGKGLACGQKRVIWTFNVWQTPYASPLLLPRGSDVHARKRGEHAINNMLLVKKRVRFSKRLRQPVPTKSLLSSRRRGTSLCTPESGLDLCKERVTPPNWISILG